MVAQDSEGQTIDGKNRCEKLKPIPNPFSPVLKRFSGGDIFSVKKSSRKARLTQRLVT